MEILISIDDTDNMESKGTGELCQMICQQIERNNWGQGYGITRHQLLVHEDIPYTSHNSAMCFKADINEKYLQSIIDFASKFLEEESAEGSDPGLCVAVIDSVEDKNKLVDFGLKAKQYVLNKEEAYHLAEELKIHLSEHGGTGEGVIGALAGAGLRLTGNDGRFKGKHSIAAPQGIISVEGLCKHQGIDMVRGLQGEAIEPEALVALGEKVKTVLLEEQAVLLVYKKDISEDLWHTCTKQQLRSF